MSETCFAMVGYHGRRIYSITVHTKRGNFVPLLKYDFSDPLPYNYATFEECYRAVLNVLKQNHFRTNSYEEFGAKWYDIAWYDVYNPMNIEKFGLTESEEH